MLNSQRKRLKAQAHDKKPVVIIGAGGVSDGLLAELEVALHAHELIKVRVNAGDRVERTRMIDAMTASSGAELVQAIGHIAVLYRKRPEQKRAAEKSRASRTDRVRNGARGRT